MGRSVCAGAKQVISAAVVAIGSNARLYVFHANYIVTTERLEITRHFLEAQVCLLEQRIAIVAWIRGKRRELAEVAHTIRRHVKHFCRPLRGSDFAALGHVWWYV